MSRVVTQIEMISIITASSLVGFGLGYRMGHTSCFRMFENHINNVQKLQQDLDRAKLKYDSFDDKK